MIKTLEIQIEVPEGATHYEIRKKSHDSETTIAWWKVGEVGVYYFVEWKSEWVLSKIYYERYKDNIKPIVEVKND